MGTHLIPRETGGEGRILLVFTSKGFVATLIGLAIGGFLNTFFSAIGATAVGWVVLAICALTGFIIGQVKMPKSNSFDLFKKTGGDYIYEIIAKYFAFKKKRKIYTYDKGGSKK